MAYWTWPTWPFNIRLMASKNKNLLKTSFNWDKNKKHWYIKISSYSLYINIRIISLKIKLLQIKLTCLSLSIILKMVIKYIIDMQMVWTNMHNNKLSTVYNRINDKGYTCYTCLWYISKRSTSSCYSTVINVSIV